MLINAALIDPKSNKLSIELKLYYDLCTALR